MVTLKELMDKYPTIKGNRCPACGNLWFFDRGSSLLCTTCYEVIKEDSGYKILGGDSEVHKKTKTDKT